jgi:hypothetical protein
MERMFLPPRGGPAIPLEIDSYADSFIIATYRGIREPYYWVKNCKAHLGFRSNFKYIVTTNTSHSSEYYPFPFQPGTCAPSNFHQSFLLEKSEAIENSNHVYVFADAHSICERGPLAWLLEARA